MKDGKTGSRWVMATAAIALLAGCAVGPDFSSPKLSDTAGLGDAATPTVTESAPVPGGAAQTLHAAADIPAEWWTLFHSPALDSVIKQALAANPDLKAAEATLRQAQELAAAQSGTMWPSVSAQVSAERMAESSAALGVSGSNFTSYFGLSGAQLQVSYVLDVFGGERRAIEASEASARYQEFELRAEYLSLTANLVTAAIEEASLRGQIAATKEIVADQEHQLGVIEQQLTLGGAARSDQLSQQAALAQTRATLPSLEKQLAQIRNELTALVGKFPSEALDERFSLESLSLPTDLPVSLPSSLVQQRPDVRAAEETLHHASAEVGVATANQFPQLTLSADVGGQAGSLSKMFSDPTAIWSLGGAIAQPIFEGGQLLHEKRAAVAAYDAAEAQYHSVVLTAFRNVADSLRALSSDADALKAQAAAERSAADSLALSKQQFGLGSISYLTLLNAERTEQQAKIALIQAQAARLSDTAALFQALGGGWWDLASQQTASNP